MLTEPLCCSPGAAAGHGTVQGGSWPALPQLPPLWCKTSYTEEQGLPAAGAPLLNPPEGLKAAAAGSQE